MIILRLFLYLICIVSIGWSVLVFGGPPIIKRLISEYSDGALIPSGVTVSPKLSIGISRLEFNVQNEINGWHIEGFSRASKLSWSLFGEKPFLEIKLGPSVLRDYATTESVNFFTPSFQKIDWENIAWIANIKNLALNSSSKINSLTLAGKFNLESKTVSDVNIDLEKFSAENDGSIYSANLIKGDLTELNFNAPITEQLFSSTFAIEDIIVSQPNINVPKAMIELSLEKAVRNFSIDLHDVKLSELGGSIKQLTFDGYFNQLNVLQVLNVASADTTPLKKSPKFPEIFARIKKSGHEQYQAKIEGTIEEFELFGSDNFIGLLPPGNFVIDLETDRAISTVTSTSKINFNTDNSNDIFGFVEMGFSSELFTNLGCAFWECKLSDFILRYKINFDDDWIRGSASCKKSICGFAEMDHLVRTSNTVNVFTTLNQANILNPLSSLYFFGAMSSGRKINEGHELKLQF